MRKKRGRAREAVDKPEIEEDLLAIPEFLQREYRPKRTTNIMFQLRGGKVVETRIFRKFHDVMEAHDYFRAFAHDRLYRLGHKGRVVTFPGSRHAIWSNYSVARILKKIPPLYKMADMTPIDALRPNSPTETFKLPATRYVDGSDGTVWVKPQKKQPKIKHLERTLTEDVVTLKQLCDFYGMPTRLGRVRLRKAIRRNPKMMKRGMGDRWEWLEKSAELEWVKQVLAVDKNPRRVESGKRRS